jgi:hypothetical protein
MLSGSAAGAEAVRPAGGSGVSAFAVENHIQSPTSCTRQRARGACIAVRIWTRDLGKDVDWRIPVCVVHFLLTPLQQVQLVSRLVIVQGRHHQVYMQMNMYT